MLKGNKKKPPIPAESPAAFIPDQAILTSEAMKDQKGHPPRGSGKSKDPYREDRVSLDEPSHEDAKKGQPDTQVSPG